MFGGMPGGQGVLPAPASNPAWQGVPPGSPGYVDGPPLTPEASALDLSGIPPQLLDAVGLGPDGPDARTVDITDDEAFDSDPLSPHVADPEILNILREFEQRQGNN
jgi:hypothetical protein